MKGEEGVGGAEEREREKARRERNIRVLVDGMAEGSLGWWGAEGNAVCIEGFVSRG